MQEAEAESSIFWKQYRQKRTKKTPEAVRLLLIVLQPPQARQRENGMALPGRGQGTVASGIGDGELKICV